MNQTLDEVKVRLRQSFLGKAGIHAVGVSRAEQSVRIYIDADAAMDAPMLDQLQRAAAPFRVTVISEEKPQASH